MLVPLFVPAQGFGYVGGQWSTLKTFVTNDLAVAIASGGTFAGQQVVRRGVVVQVELEGSNSEARLSAAAMIRERECDALPIVHLTKKPPNIMESSARANPAFKVWVQQLVSYSKEVAAYYELPLALITIDPQNKFAGFRDEQSSAEGQIVTNAFEDLARLAGCTVLVVDHFGKDASAGLRGTSVKETNPLCVLTTGERKKDVYARRQLEIRKMRNGRSGVATSFWAEDCEVPIQCRIKAGDEMTTEMVNVKTLVLRWGDEVFAVEEGSDEEDGGKGKSREGRPPIKQRMALRVLSELISKAAPPSSSEVSWVSLEAWYEALLDQTVIESDDPNRRRTFQRIKDGLLEKNEIKVQGKKICIPL
jgi:AAA domain